MGAADFGPGTRGWIAALVLGALSPAAVWASPESARLRARAMWVLGRTHAELGKPADLRRDRQTARSHFEQAVGLAEQDNDPPGADAARRWVHTPYPRNP